MKKMINFLKEFLKPQEIVIENYWIKPRKVSIHNFKNLVNGSLCIDESGDDPILVYKSESGSVYFVPMKKIGFKD